MIKAKRRICVKLTSNVLLKGNSFCMPLAMFHCCNPGFKQSPQNSLNKYNVSAENVIRKTPIIAASSHLPGETQPILAVHEVTAPDTKAVSKLWLAKDALYIIYDRGTSFPLLDIQHVKPRILSGRGRQLQGGHSGGRADGAGEFPSWGIGWAKIGGRTSPGP
eukprot:GHVU01083153.1.p1 GENE.GHVU01083153.1~~GHVU01083153.1.p1  ORF type:complete len:163 (-),score=14.30 GHVU01083153.1:47-535(-)